MRLIYVSNARMPTAMAHGLQIMQNCEAFAGAGAEVSLWVPRRERPTDDPFDYYGVDRVFRLRRLPAVNLSPLFKQNSTAWKLAFYFEVITYALVAMIGALFTRADLIYCRDPLILLFLVLVKPRHKLAYEAHLMNETRWGLWLQRTILRRVAHTIAITPPLRDSLDALQAESSVKTRLLVAHDGFRLARFDGLPARSAAREAVGWPRDAFIVGYAGRLTTAGLAKGVDVLLEACARFKDHADLVVALVGGPEDAADLYRAQWKALGMPESRLIITGQVPAPDVPLYMAALDVGTIPMPALKRFAYYASPIKLFEYMAAGCVVVASDFPSYADVLRHGENALLTPASDVDALADAIGRLYADPALRDRLTSTALHEARAHYTWGARAKMILDFVAAANIR